MTRMRAHTAFFLAAACATAAPPPELSDARNSYARAEQGPAQKYKPDQLHEAQVSLDQAEKNFKEHGADERTKTLAYVASRKARLADVNGATEQLIDEKKQASNQMAEQAAAGLERYKKEADDTREKLEAAKIAYRQESRGTIITMPGNVTFR
ncbi:MAG TPA: DUF4398 domain-containing protein, partial [Anaeromyxobacteraceae bacterium]|nr:DUF4398 domain-containing protein [Anaeromyxobacteraceae bacterium]